MSTNPVVYLAGPISGESWQEAKDWRDWASVRLATLGIATSDPLRGKDYLSHETAIPQAVGKKPMSTSKGIVGRDHYDVRHATLILVNFLGTKKISVGTVWEIGVAYEARIPVIVVMEEGSMHDHPMVRECAYAVVGTLEDGVKIATHFLSPYTALPQDCTCR